MTIAYTNGEVTIVWKPEICIHSEKCCSGLSFVFAPKSKPWINDEGAPTDEISSQVSQCHSNSTASDALQIQLVQYGVGIVMAPCEIALNNGTTATVESFTALYRSGASINKPFCDGSHTKIGFEAE